MYGRFAKRKVTRWPYYPGVCKAGFPCIDKWYLFKFPAMRAVKIICGKSQMIVDFTVFQPSKMVGKTMPHFAK